MPTTATIRGITITYSSTNVVASGTYWDGEPWVQTNGPLTVTGWTPAMTGTGNTLQNGGMLNPRGTITHVQGFDGRSPYDGGAPTNVVLPLTMNAGDVLIVGTSGAGNGNTQTVQRPAYFPLPGRSFVDYMLTLTVVSTAPAATDFRPNAMGNPAQRQLRSHNDIVWSRLPNSISSAHPNAPTLTSVENIWAAFMGDILGGWTADQCAPNFQHPGYGQYLAAAVSEALLMACSDLTNAQKTLLVKRLIQAGIDLWGAFRDGRSQSSNGGHAQGRKPLVIFAGHMLGDEDMANPDVFLGVDRFREQDAYYDGAPTWQGWRHRWSYNRSNVLASAYETTLPAIWGVVGSNDERFFDHYRGSATLGATVGQAIAMGLIGRTREWSIDNFASIWIHMTAPSTAMLTAATRVPEAFEYYRAVPVGAGTIGPQYATAFSHRGGGGGVFQETHWPLGQVTALMPYLTLETAIGLGSTFPVAITFSDVVYGNTVTVECFNADPLSLASRSWIGAVNAIPGTDAGIWAGAVANANVPNAYGYHSNTVTVTSISVEAASEADWALIVIYDMGGSYVTTPTMLLFPFATV